MDRLALTAFTALAKLPLPSSEHKQAVDAERIMHRLLTLNACADLTQWSDSGFSSSSEPPNTKEFGGPLSVNLPGVACG